MTAIVMVHGAFCGGWAFEHFRAPVRGGRLRVLAPDLRGHGAGRAGQPWSRRLDDRLRRRHRRALRRPGRAAGAAGPLHGRAGGADGGAQGARRRPWCCWRPRRPGASPAPASRRRRPPSACRSWAPSPPAPWTPDRGLMRTLQPGPHAQGRARGRGRAAAARERRAVRETLNWWLDPFMTTSVGPGPLAGAGPGDRRRARRGPLARPPRAPTAERIGASLRGHAGHEPLAGRRARLGRRGRDRACAWLADEASARPPEAPAGPGRQRDQRPGAFHRRGGQVEVAASSETRIRQAPTRLAAATAPARDRAGPAPRRRRPPGS